MMASVRCVVPGGSAGVDVDIFVKGESRCCRSCPATPPITQRLRLPATFLRAQNQWESMPNIRMMLNFSNDRAWRTFDVILRILEQFWLGLASWPPALLRAV